MTRLAAVCASSAMCVLWARICVHVQVSALVKRGLSVGHVLFLTIHPHTLQKKRRGRKRLGLSEYITLTVWKTVKKRGEEERKWDTQQQAVGSHSVTLRLSNMISAVSAVCVGLLGNQVFNGCKKGGVIDSKIIYIYIDYIRGETISHYRQLL